MSDELIKKLKNQIQTLKDQNEILELQKLKSQITSRSIIENKKQIIDDLLKILVDPVGDYYGIDHQTFLSKLQGELDISNKIAAIDTSEVNFQKKGFKYDPVLESFAMGSNGIISSWENQKNSLSSLIIRGVGGGSRKAIKHCWENNRTFYAIDTGYFGNVKTKVWHRATKNALQNTGPIIDRPDDRLKRIGYSFRKFRLGARILICPPSDKVMKLWDQPEPDIWVENTVNELKKYTDREIIVRMKPSRADRISTNTIQQALEDNIYCLVTYNSIAATEALMYGKPAIALGPNAAQVLCNTSLSEVENLNIPTKDEMMSFVRHLSYCQFTLNEFMDGTAWRILNEGD